MRKALLMLCWLGLAACGDGADGPPAAGSAPTVPTASAAAEQASATPSAGGAEAAATGAGAVPGGADGPAGSFRLAAFVAPAGEPEAPAVPVSLELDPEAGRLAGDAGCNRYTGTYAIADGLLVPGPIAATKRLCPPPAMSTEDRYLAALRAPLAIEAAADGTFALIAGDGTQLRFEGVPADE